MDIYLKVVNTPVFEDLGGPQGPGHRFVFSDDIVLERVDNKTPGHGLPKDEKDRRVGTHSGFVTTLRVAPGGDPFFPFPADIFLSHYEGTYKFIDVPLTPPSGTGTPTLVLRKGTITAYGVLVQDSNNDFVPVEPKNVAITGGTAAYAKARGQIFEPVDKPRKLEIELN